MATSTVIRNQGYVAGWGHEVDRKPLAMRDACPHRLLPLSMNLREGDEIRGRYHGLVPYNVIIDVGVASENNGVRGIVNDAMTPESESGSHYFWGMARNFDVHNARFTRRLKTQQGDVFLEHVEMFEAPQRAIAANPDTKLRGFNIDKGGVKAYLVNLRLLKQPAWGTPAECRQ